MRSSFVNALVIELTIVSRLSVLDLEESFGTIETTKAAYNRMFDLKIITAQVCRTFFVCRLERPELCIIS